MIKNFDLKYTSKKNYTRVYLKKKKNFEFDSIFWLIRFKIISLICGIFYFLYEVLFHYKDYFKLIAIKGTKIKKEALIIAGGQSANRINSKKLREFKKKNEIFFVNYTSINNKFKKITADYQVVSDPNTINLNSKMYKNNKKRIMQIQDFKKNIFNNKNIKIFTPFKRIKEMSELIDYKNIYGFCDSDLSYVYKSTVPILPRGYTTSTTFKAISLASWMGYKKIFIIGMDHDYLSTLKTGKSNEILQVERHSYDKYHVYDYTNCYTDISHYIFEFSKLLYDLKKLTLNKKIYCLDYNSFTPGLKKIFSKKFF
jgi:hypothetical protein